MKPKADKHQNRDRGTHQSFQVIDWGKLRMESPVAIATRLRGVQTGVLPVASLEGLVSSETLGKLLSRDWVTLPRAEHGARTRGNVPMASSLVVTGSKSAVATLTTTTVVTDPKPSTWGAVMGVAQGTFTPEYQPQRIDFGELMPEEKRSARITLTSPNDTTLNVVWADQSHAPENLLLPRFTVDRLTTYTHVWKNFGNKFAVVREVDQTTTEGSIDIREGQDITIDVSFASGPDENDRFNNTLQVAGPSAPWTVRIPAQALVTLLGDTGSVVVTVDGGFEALKGQQVNANATLIRIGGPAEAMDVTISGDFLPNGVTMTNVTTTLGQGEERTIPLQFNVAQNAPPMRGFEALLGVSWQTGSRELGIGISVYDPLLYSKADINAGSMTGTIEVTIKSDGSWSWHVSMQEHGKLVGENYIIAFGLVVPGDEGNLGLYKTTRGALAAVLLPGDSSRTVDEAGSHPDILEHFFELVDAGVYFEADTQDNPLPLLAFIVGALFTAGAVGFIKDLAAPVDSPVQPVSQPPPPANP
ncbi:hypothetical protein F6X37_30450 [Paraburkholderia sp. 31.1]|uniref:hypothetical protein n=1 Tax=Paraburkholderia sp. 31.1 TaxID=2615205 RepID=UPI00165650FF|nr:hypothetical protein [Paraburkholderia sp. 31.1]MBC8725719.1 hypothetical protein [Paraburkholderia sp. 31.1]